MSRGPGRLLTTIICAGLLLSACGAGVATVVPTTSVTLAPTAAATTPTPPAATPTAAPATATSAAATPTAAPAATPTAAATPAVTATPEITPEVTPSPNANDLLAIVKARGYIEMSTDPNYKPQSFLQPDGSFAGFDIDVGTAIATHLGLGIKFTTPDWR